MTSIPPQSSTSIPNRLANLCLLIGRFALAALFLGGAMHKAVNPVLTETLLTTAGFAPGWIWPAMAVSAFGAACLIMGLWLAPIAFILAGYCILTSFFHYVPGDPVQMSILVKNWAIAGGLLVLVAHELTRPHETSRNA